VDDARDPLGAQPVTERRGLGPAQGAQREAVEVPVEEVVGVLDVRVPDEIKTVQFR
jgi:hypothetical protein